MGNLIDRWPQLGCFFPKLGHFFHILEKRQGMHPTIVPSSYASDTTINV